MYTNLVVITANDNTEVNVGPFPDYKSADLWCDEYNHRFHRVFAAYVTDADQTLPLTSPANWGL
jgi:hypothetical protein